MAKVMPKWLDDVQGVDFAPEKALLDDLEMWAEADGWQVTDGSSLSPDLSRRTDVLIEQPAKRHQMRIAVLPKARRAPGTIRIDTSTYRVFDLVYQPRGKRWRVETAAVPLSDDLKASGWSWLKELAFRP